jgi:hypothetical protein
MSPHLDMVLLIELYHNFGAPSNIGPAGGVCKSRKMQGKSDH